MTPRVFVLAPVIAVMACSTGGSSRLDGGMVSEDGQPVNDGAPVTQDGPSSVGSPLVVAAAELYACNVVADATSLYWGTQRTPTITPVGIRSAPISGGAPKTLAQGETATRIALNGDSVFWTTDVSMTSSERFTKFIPKAGGTATAFATGVCPALGTRADATGVFCATQAHGDIFFLPMDGGNGTLLTTDVGFLTASEMDDTYFYWVNRTQARLMRMNKDGSGVTKLADLPPQSVGGNLLAIDSTNAYISVVDNSVQSIVTVPLSGGSASVLVQGSAGPMVSDGINLYWSGLHSISKVAVAGGTPETLVADPTMYPCGQIAVDSNFVYWADSSHSQILKIPK